MNQKNLDMMDAKELETYAQVLGFTVKAGKSDGEKRDIIKNRRDRIASITVLGVDLEIQVKRLHDKRVVELLNAHDDESLEKGMRMLLGDEQYARIAEACVEEDGTVDVDAMAYAVIAITGNRELKNF